MLQQRLSLGDRNSRRQQGFLDGTVTSDPDELCAASIVQTAAPGTGCATRELRELFTGARFNCNCPFITTIAAVTGIRAEGQQESLRRRKPKPVLGEKPGSSGSDALSPLSIAWRQSGWPLR